MAVPLVVTIVVNGSVVASVAPARIAAGRVVAPLMPIVVRLASRVAYDPAAAAVVVERDGRRIVVPVVLVAGGVPYVELVPVVRELGGSATFDDRSKTLAIVLPADDVIATPPPFDRAAPHVSPSPIFTPAPPAPTPRPVVSGNPRPRRTAIPAVPSQPIPPADPGDVPDPGPTTRHR